MEQFTLEKYLKNPNRKVVTRRGNPVRIICTDRKHGEDTLPIVFLEESPDGIGEFLLSCRADGTCDNYDTPYDLFFADEKEKKLTEFEKAMIQFSHERNSLIQFEHTTEEINAHLHKYSKKLLDLATKEIRKEQQEKLGTLEMPIDVTELYYIKGKQDAGEAKVKELVAEFEKGRQEALKSLPKWKKINHSVDLDEYVCVIDFDGTVVTTDILEKGDYFIKLNELLKLPKE